MAVTVDERKRSIKHRTKVKTGCATCRIRKIKCDEKKPACQKCVSTGRTCDGYESPFRSFTSEPIVNIGARSIKSAAAPQAVFSEIAPEDIDILNRYFSTKTMFDVNLGCDEEARQILQASLISPPIQHALASLRTLRKDLETHGDDPAPIMQQTPSYRYGLQQYGMALRGLASTLSSPSSERLKLALLCCQILISIEQVRKNYAAMAQHIIRGLSIMHEYHARPYFVDVDTLAPAYHEQLPLLDVFIIKLFAAPCKFADVLAKAEASDTALSMCSTPAHKEHAYRNLRTIVPDRRTEITRIAASTIELLGKVSRVESVEIARGLLSEKAALLDSLESWLINLDFVQRKAGPSSPEPISVSFLRMFHVILKVVLLGAMESSSDLHAKLRAENNLLQESANVVAERVKTYKMCSGTFSDGGERCTA